MGRSTVSLRAMNRFMASNCIDQPVILLYLNRVLSVHGIVVPSTRSPTAAEMGHSEHGFSGMGVRAEEHMSPNRPRICLSWFCITSRSSPLTSLGANIRLNISSSRIDACIVWGTATLDLCTRCRESDMPRIGYQILR